MTSSPVLSISHQLALLSNTSLGAIFFVWPLVTSVSRVVTVRLAAQVPTPVHRRPPPRVPSIFGAAAAAASPSFAAAAAARVPLAGARRIPSITAPPLASPSVDRARSGGEAQASASDGPERGALPRRGHAHPHPRAHASPPLPRGGREMGQRGARLIGNGGGVGDEQSGGRRRWTGHERRAREWTESAAAAADGDERTTSVGEWPKSEKIAS